MHCYTTPRKASHRGSEGERIRLHGELRAGRDRDRRIGAGELREGEDWIPPGPPAEWRTEAMTLPGSEVTVTAFTLEYERDAYRRLQREDKVRLIEDRIQSKLHTM
jgi:hypothetical protein